MSIFDDPPPSRSVNTTAAFVNRASSLSRELKSLTQRIEHYGNMESTLHDAQELLNKSIPHTRATLPLGRQFDEIETEMARAVHALHNKKHPAVTVDRLLSAAEKLDDILGT